MTDLSKVRARPDGGTYFEIDTARHDKDLIDALAEAIRADEEVAFHLVQYAKVCNDIRDRATKRDSNPAETLALCQDADELYGLIEDAMDWQKPGDGLTVSLDAQQTDEIAAALVRRVAQRIQSEDKAAEAKEGAAA